MKVGIPLVLLIEVWKMTSHQEKVIKHNIEPLIKVAKVINLMQGDVDDNLPVEFNLINTFCDTLIIIRIVNKVVVMVIIGMVVVVVVERVVK
jgi:hypothetical protein